MRVSYSKRLALIIALQAAMIAGPFLFGPSLDRLTTVFDAAAWILPFVGYFVAFYDAPFFARWSRITRPIVLTLSFIAATVIGFWILLPLIFMFFAAFGGHHW